MLLLVLEMLEGFNCDDNLGCVHSLVGCNEYCQPYDHEVTMLMVIITINYAGSLPLVVRLIC